MRGRKRVWAHEKADACHGRVLSLLLQWSELDGCVGEKGRGREGGRVWPLTVGEEGTDEGRKQALWWSIWLHCRENDKNQQNHAGLCVRARERRRLIKGRRRQRWEKYAGRLGSVNSIKSTMLNWIFENLKISQQLIVFSLYSRSLQRKMFPSRQGSSSETATVPAHLIVQTINFNTAPQLKSSKSKQLICKTNILLFPRWKP